MRSNIISLIFNDNVEHVKYINLKKIAEAHVSATIFGEKLQREGDIEDTKNNGMQNSETPLSRIEGKRMMQSRNDNMFLNGQFGEFDQANKEYVLRNPHTPRPWRHLLSNEKYLTILDQWGVGSSLYGSLCANIVTRDGGAGRCFYLRDMETGEFFSPTVWPVDSTLDKFDNFEVHYGLGYLKWLTSRNDLQVTLTATVAMDAPVELYSLEITNTSPNNRRLDLFGYLEWSFFGAPRELGAPCFSEFNKPLNAQIGRVELPPQYRMKQSGFFTCDQEILGYDGWRLSFLGQPGSVSSPAAVRKGQCGNMPSPVLSEPCGAIHSRVEIPSGKTKCVTYAVGVFEDYDEVANLRQRYLGSAAVNNELQKVAAYWDQQLSGYRIEFDDASLSAFADVWLKYQMVQNARWTRWGGDKGYRDVLQDSAGLRLLDVKPAKKMILTAAEHQRSDGFAPRQWVLEPWRKHDWRDYRDSPFWLVYGIEKYLKETGYFEILDTEIPFVDKKDKLPLMEHLHLAVDFLYRNRGSHGLCLIGAGDWLDSLNTAGVRGKGESVWLTQATIYALRELAEIARRSNREDRVTIYEQWRQELLDAVDSAGWDGEWYKMGFDDAGQPIGSASCPDGGKIFLNPQAWAVLAGCGDQERQLQALASVRKHLSVGYGDLCFAPKYSGFDPSVGRISLWPTEGVSVYNHAVLFKIAALCELGMAEEAWDDFTAIVPAAGKLDLTRCGAEPFCVVNAFTGPDWPVPGWSYTGWWTGSASWAIQLLVEDFFGAKADYDGLRISPRLPASLSSATVFRKFRGKEYEICITNSSQNNEPKLVLDDQEIEGNLLLPQVSGNRHTVKVVY